MPDDFYLLTIKRKIIDMKFMDEDGQEWQIVINEETIYSMRLITGRLSFTGPTNLPTEVGDMAKCIAMACFHDCKRRGIEAKDLLPKLTGKTLNLALDAFIRAYFAFWEPLFPQSSEKMLKEWNQAKRNMATKRQSHREQLAAV